MFGRIKVVEVDLGKPLRAIEGLHGYQSVWVIARLHGRPLGKLMLPVTNGYCTATALGRAVVYDLKWPMIRQHLLYALEAQPAKAPTADKLFQVAPNPKPVRLPLFSVAICTRDRTESLIQCLSALQHLDYENVEVIVVDNAPASPATHQRVTQEFPHVRYVCEPRPGLDWARNRAILEAKGEIIAFTDDDVIVDPQWAKAIAEVFVDNADIMAVTGLVIPHEIETEAQYLFERSGGFGKGFARMYARADTRAGAKAGYTHGGTGRFGTGANMAYRRSVFNQIGLFDPALDVGTPTNGAGDLEMFFRVIKAGYTLVYEPAALVRHIHRQDMAGLHKQLFNNGVGLFAYFDAAMQNYPDERREFGRFRNWWLKVGHIKRYLIARFHPTMLPRSLIQAELKGALIGIFGKRYHKAKLQAARIEAEQGVPPKGDVSRSVQSSTSAQPAKPFTILVAALDLGLPIRPLPNAADHTRTDITVTRFGQMLGKITLQNCHQAIGVQEIKDALCDQLSMKLLTALPFENEGDLWVDATRSLKQRMLKRDEPLEVATRRLPASISASIIISTYDRPEDLQATLRSVCQLHTTRQVEIIVIDNHPASGLTPPVVAQFPQVRYLSERRKGASYSRNTAICASSGDIIVSTDDDVAIPPDWLEKLIAPLVRADVQVVCGNILPYALQAESQQLFEKYGGLGRGPDGFEVDGHWFESTHRRPTPTWKLTGTANCAFRAAIFADPKVGMMNEELSTGGPAGLGEDIYLFYRVLKAGGKIVYEPSAYIWHKHRRTIAALKRQMFNYSKAHVAYHLATFFFDEDLRGLVNVVYGYPRWLMGLLKDAVLRRSWAYPLWFVRLHMAGALSGPWGFVRALVWVRRTGRSDVYVPVAQRTPSPGEPTLVLEIPNPVADSLQNSNSLAPSSSSPSSPTILNPISTP